MIVADYVSSFINNIIRIMFECIFKLNQSKLSVHIFHLASMFCSSGNDVDSSVFATMTKNVGELGDILFDAIECTGKQMA